MDYMNFIALSKQHWAPCVCLSSMWPDCALVPLNVHCDSCCVWCVSFKSEYPAGSCLGGFDAFFILTLIKHFSFWLLLRRVCNCVQNHLLKGKKVLRKIFKHPLLHFCVLNLTPTDTIWTLGCFCRVRQSSSGLVGWPLVNMGLKRGLAWAGPLWQGRHFCRAMQVSVSHCSAQPLLRTHPLCPLLMNLGNNHRHQKAC